MKITFENMREPIRLRGVSADRSTTSARNMRADSVIPFPSGSIPRRSALKSAEIRAKTVDIFLVVSALLFALITSCAIVTSFFFLLFGQS